MKKTLRLSLGLLIVYAALSLLSCSKHDEAPAKSKKYNIVAGTWRQSDIVLGIGVSVKVNGQKYNFPAGTSVINDQYMNAFGVASLFKPTRSNLYNFSDSGAYRITGVTSVILPVAGNNGNWTLDVYDAVLKLTSPDKSNDPHWINTITGDSLSLSLTVNIPGLGTAPLSLLLKKQQ